MIKVHSNLAAAVDERCCVSGKHLFGFLRIQIVWRCGLEILSNEEWTAV